MLLERNLQVLNFHLHLLCFLRLSVACALAPGFLLLNMSILFRPHQRYAAHTPYNPRLDVFVVDTNQCIYGGAAGYRPQVHAASNLRNQSYVNVKLLSLKSVLILFLYLTRPVGLLP